MLKEQAFLSLDVQIMLQQPSKYPAHQRYMLGACSGVYQNVIDIHYYTLPVKIPENLSKKDWKTDGAFINPYGMTRYS